MFFLACAQDILKDQWSPALTIKTALLSLQALMCSPEPGTPSVVVVECCSVLELTPDHVCNLPGDPQDAEVAKMYMKDRKEFDRTAKFWTESYAKPKSKEEAITRVCEMGFDRESAQRALEKHNWDESAAVNQLLGM